MHRGAWWIGLVVALVYLLLSLSSLLELVSWGRLSLTAAVSLCCRWEREINNLSMGVWPSKYGQGLSSPPSLSTQLFLSLNYSNMAQATFVFMAVCSFILSRFCPPPSCTHLTFLFPPWKETLLCPAIMPVCVYLFKACITIGCVRNCCGTLVAKNRSPTLTP